MSAWLVATAVPLAACMALIAVLQQTAWTARLQDRPNERSLHTRPTPRIGGIAMLGASMATASALAPELLPVWMLALLLGIVSFADDLRSLPVAVRLGAHFATAMLATLVLLPEGEWRVALAILAILTIAWMTNLYNFMDGSDGIAGGMTVIGFGAYALAAMQADASALAYASAAIAASAAGFLAFNFPPARVFMGDAGSIPTGFLAGALGLAGWGAGAWPVWFPALVFSPFIVDASVTLARRALRGERLWLAHRSHYYQRLVLSGFTSRQLALGAYAVMALVSASALYARTQGVLLQCAIIVAWGVLYAFAIATVEKGASRSAS